MHPFSKLILKSSPALAFGMSFMIQAETVNLPGQVRQLQMQMPGANEKISALTADQQKNNETIGALQTALNTVHHEVSGLTLKNSRPAGIRGTVSRTANGHGR